MSTVSHPHFVHIIRVVCAMLLSFTLASGADDPSAQYEKANQLYASGDYSAAAGLYEAIFRSGHISADVCYNLAAAKYRLSENGESVLWMKRALILQPGMPEASQSLNFLRQQQALLEFADTPFQRFLLGLSPAAWTWLITLGCWGAAIFFLAAISILRFRAHRRALITVAVLLLILSGAAWRLSLYRVDHLDARNFWIAIPTKTEIVSAPIPDAKTIISLSPGSEVRLVQDAGAWAYVEIPDGTRGWVRKDSLTRVWPIVTGTTTL